MATVEVGEYGNHDAMASRAIIDHYDRPFTLNRSPAQTSDLVEYLKSL